MGKRKSADSAAQKASAGGDAAPLCSLVDAPNNGHGRAAACCPLFGVLKKERVAHLDQELQGSHDGVSRRTLDIEMQLKYFWCSFNPLWMGHGLEARRFGFYPHVTH